MLKLFSNFSASHPTTNFDVVKTKKALYNLGYYKPRDHDGRQAFTSFADSNVFNGVKQFQKDNNLRVDGWMRPNGPTENKLNGALYRQKTDRQKTDQIGNQVQQIKNLSLKKSVGVNGQNDPEDIKKVKKAMSVSELYSTDKNEINDGRWNASLQSGINTLQAKYNVDNNGVGNNGLDQKGTRTPDYGEVTGTIQPNDILLETLHQIAEPQAAMRGLSLTDGRAWANNPDASLSPNVDWEKALGILTGNKTQPIGQPQQITSQQIDAKQVPLNAEDGGAVPDDKPSDGSPESSNQGLKMERKDRIYPNQTEEQILEGKKRLLEDAAAVGGSVGLEKSAKYLNHFLNGNGEPIEIDLKDIRKEPFLGSAEEINQDRIINKTFTGETERNHILNNALKNIKDGETLELSDHWDKDLTGGDLLHPDDYLALGSQRLDSTPGFTATRKGSVIQIEGTVEHNGTETYDFDEGKTGDYGISGAKELQDKGYGKSFDIIKKWKQNFTATVEITDEKDSQGRPVLKSKDFMFEDIE